jgi:crotonobetainyl-CoA:carnitine CoA-transferase CaiB-like acyl-CoA transferase
MKALEGLGVLDLTHYAGGPHCTKMFACLGAEVIKVERPGSGDGARTIGPFPGDEPHPETSALFLYLNTGKKSVTLDLKSDRGVEIFKKLAESADVVVENFRPGVMASLGRDYAEMEKIKPVVIMTSISNFGQSGPYREYKADELVMYAFAGLMNLTGEPDREPIKVGALTTANLAGANAYLSTMTALMHRLGTGEGQHIEVSILESCVFQLPGPILTWLYGHQIQQREGNAGFGQAAWGPYECRDGYAGIIAGPYHRWNKIAELMEDPRLADERFSTAAGRQEHKEEMEALMLPWLAEHDKKEIFHAGQRLGLVTSYVATPEDLLESEQLTARNFFVEVEHPVVGRHRYAGAPFIMSETPWQTGRAPLLGEHNEEVYCERLGLSREELARLEAEGIV